MTGSSLPLVLGLLIAIAGCESTAPPESSASPTVVAIDSATDTVLIIERPDRFPAAHPETGRRTLSQALYCETCDKWYAVPPPDVIQSVPGGGMCPVHNTPLLPQGPIPSGGE